MAEFVNQLLRQAGELWGPAMEHLVEGLVGVFFSGGAVGVLAILVYGCWASLSEGLRREQRAQSFVRLLEIGLGAGRTVEETVASMARAGVSDLGRPFRRLAGWMARGWRLGAALEEVPNFLPSTVAAMLRVGESTGNLPRVLSVCRGGAGTGVGWVHRQTNELIVLLVVSPAGPAVLWVLSVFVLPKFRELGLDMGLPADGVMNGCFAASFWAGNVMAVAWVGLLMLEMGRSGGNWLLREWLRPLGRVLDDCVLRIPWKRKRLQRDFAAMLGVLLDGGVVEEQAVLLAGEATANSAFRQRAEVATVRLREGVGLAEALSAMDDAGEFSWRLRNAVVGGRDFQAALGGWRESLAAQAFQEEQMFSQCVSTAFVVLNGLMVGLGAVGVFHFLVGAMEVASW